MWDLIKNFCFVSFIGSMPRNPILSVKIDKLKNKILHAQKWLYNKSKTLTLNTLATAVQLNNIPAFC